MAPFKERLGTDLIVMEGVEDCGQVGKGIRFLKESTETFSLVKEYRFFHFKGEFTLGLESLPLDFWRCLAPKEIQTTFAYCDTIFAIKGR